jgi:hypothetical protein
VARRRVRHLAKARSGGAADATETANLQLV